MKFSYKFRMIVLLELALPIFLLSVGLFEGLMQTIYRSGLIHQSSAMGTSYYQGLTLHGVINAIVLTTFFAVAFGHLCMAYFLQKEPNFRLVLLSAVLMIGGTLMAAWAILAGKASVLYTFYPPLMAHPIFYLGAALLIVGSWVAYFSWIPLYLQWRRKHPDTNMPLAVLGTLVNFTVWFVCTLAVAYEVLVFLLPWSLGWIHDINIPLCRMLFWFFGHALVYFWLLPSYIMFYVMLPKIAGGKLYSANAARLALLLFLLLSVPVGVHHQFSEPGITRTVKWIQAILTFGITIPSFITAFTMAASLEYAGRKRGARSLFSWMRKLPYFDKDNYLFGYLICGLILFIFGGLTGIVNASANLSAIVHNTAWVPGHFHMTVAGPVFLGILGMSMYALEKLTGNAVALPRWNTIVPYLWVIGILFFSTGMMLGGLHGEPRRTNLGLTYLNPQHPLYHSAWVMTTTMAVMGGVLMFIAGFAYIFSFMGTLFGKAVAPAIFTLPESEVLHQESRIPAFDNFKPWIAAMIVIILLAYVPALMDVLRLTNGNAVPFDPANPIPLR